jgi:mono/diheme cytochrome c family protein
VCLALLAGCSSDEADGGATGSVCPPSSTLTYDSFGEAFMARYCVRCHSSPLTGSARNGAPSDHDFDTLEGLHATEPEHIDEQAAAGPDNVNTAMPPGDPRPSEAERRELGEWVACGMP